MKKQSHSTPYFFHVKEENASASAAEPVPILIRRRKGARSIVLRYQPLMQALTLTMPYYVSMARGLRFVEEKRGWIMQQLAKKPEAIPFTDGQVIPVRGESVRIVHVGGRGLVRKENGILLVTGDRAFISRRVRDWLIGQARETITAMAQEKAHRLNQRITKISLRDMHSMWGSCTQGGLLSFSWRLILAPPEVLDYIVSHEVAHLAEMNHSPAFWEVVAGLCNQWQASRRWLRRHGDTLYGYG